MDKHACEGGKYGGLSLGQAFFYHFSLDVTSHVVKELVLPDALGVTGEPMPQVWSPSVGDLTPERFAREYPQMCQYFRALDAMTYPMLFDREELHNFWTGPVEREGQIIRRTRILWRNRPVHVSIASMAIHTCTRLRMDRSQAKSLCMSFNSTGCCFDSWACNGLHMCLCCGSTKHGYGECQMTRNLERESQKFLDSFGLYPLDPSSKWEGKDLEKILVKLAESAEPGQSTEVWKPYSEAQL